MIDYQSAADRIGVDLAAVKAIAEVERIGRQLDRIESAARNPQKVIP
jgi:hypothetical protein